MSIRELFEAQQREFISLKEILELMCQGDDGVTLEMAATVLYRILDDGTQSENLWVSKSISSPSPLPAKRRREVMGRLAYVAMAGAYEEKEVTFEDMDDAIPF